MENQEIIKLKSKIRDIVEKGSYINVSDILKLVDEILKIQQKQNKKNMSEFYDDAYYTGYNNGFDHGYNTSISTFQDCHEITIKECLDNIQSELKTLKEIL